MSDKRQAAETAGRLRLAQEQPLADVLKYLSDLKKTYSAVCDVVDAVAVAVDQHKFNTEVKVGDAVDLDVFVQLVRGLGFKVTCSGPDINTFDLYFIVSW